MSPHLRQALRQVVEALTEVTCYDWAHKPVSVEGNDRAAAMCDAAITAAEAALAQPEPEPVAWLWYPPKKPLLRELRFSDSPPVELRSRGYIAEPLYSRTPTQSAELAAVTAERDQLRTRLDAISTSYRVLFDEVSTLKQEFEKLTLSIFNEKQPAPIAWVVFGEYDGEKLPTKYVSHCKSDADDYVTERIANGVTEASKWLVRPVYPEPPDTPQSA